MLIGIARKYSELRNTRSPSAHQWWACKIVIDWEVRPNGKMLGLRSWRSHILEQFPNDLSHDMLKYMQYCPTRAVTDHCYLNWFAICLFHAHRKGLNYSSERKSCRLGTYSCATCLILDYSLCVLFVNWTSGKWSALQCV